MRSATPPAAVGLALRWRPAPPPRFARALASQRAAPLLVLGALGEMVVDKLPSTPPRTDPEPLVGRALAGGFCGAVVGAVRRSSPVGLAVAGAASAVASSFAMMDLRNQLGKRLDVPDTAVAVAEDALAVGLSAVAARAALA